MVLITANTSTAESSAAVNTTFTGGGYEFAGQIYDNLGPHKTVGLVLNVDNRGPCVACHMSGAAGHTWNAVTKDEVTGQVTAVNSAVCSTAACHDGVALPAMTPASLNASKAAFTAALNGLEAQLNALNEPMPPASRLPQARRPQPIRVPATQLEKVAPQQEQAPIALPAHKLMSSFGF
jgi:hypothetical protein